MPESIWCSFCDAVCVRSTASASSSIDSSAFFGARRPMRLLMRISTYATGYTAQLNSRSGCEKVRATFTGLLCENTLGMISPKSSSRNVTTTVLNRNSYMPPKRNTASIRFEVSMTMQMFTRLLTMSMVASSLSTSSSRATTVRLAVSRFDSRESISVRVNEKKATSDPDTIAEIKSSSRHMAPCTTICAESMSGARPIASTSAGYYCWSLPKSDSSDEGFSPVRSSLNTVLRELSLSARNCILRRR